MFDKIVGSIGLFSYKNRKIISILALVLFVCVALLQAQAIVEYSYAEESVVTDVFPQDDTVVIVYDNYDEKRIEKVIEYLEKDEHVTSIQAYANTLGLPMSPAEVSSMMGVPEVFVNTLFYIHQYGMLTTGMTLVDFATFISSDEFLENEMFSSMINDEARAQITQMSTIVNAIASEEQYTAKEISDILGVDQQLVQSVFYIAQLRNMNLQNMPSTFFAIVAGALGMDAEAIERIFNIKPVSTLPFGEFVDLITSVASYAEGVIDAEQLAQLKMLQNMSVMIKDNTPLFPDDLATLFASAGENEMFNEGSITLLYIMSISNTMDMSDIKIPLYDFFTFLSEDILTNETFSSFFDESVSAQFEDAKKMMEDGRAQLVGEDHSRMVITLDYAFESKGMNDFYKNFDKMLDDTLVKDYYLVGNSAMSYEVSGTFRQEYLIISIVTAIAVFIVVWFTFRKFSLSLLLICVIECAVFAMMSVMVVIATPIYFIALILVQCILMGSMIDYGILFTTYYKEVRKEYSVENALPETMKRATHAILTSALSIIFVTLISGMFMTGAVATILTTLGIGALCAVLLILFVLPSFLAIFDKQFIGSDTSDETSVDPFDE